MKILDVLSRFLRVRVPGAHARAGQERETQRPLGRQLSDPQAQGQPARDRADPAGSKPLLVTDPSLPQLEVAKDPERMLEVFQRHLRPLSEKVYKVRECRIIRVRHRQGKRCILEYTLRLEELDTGREQSERVTGVMYAQGHTRALWEKGRLPGPGREIPGASPPFAPFSYIPELEMLVQVFPYDHLLPALPSLMSGPSPELEPLLLARFGPGDWWTETWNTETVRYIAQIRATLRLTLQARDATSGRVEERRFYAKIYPDEGQGEQTFQVTQALWDRANAGGASFAVGRPIVYLSNLRLLVQEEVPGIHLREILVRGDEATPAVRRVARTLKNVLLRKDRVPPAVRKAARALAALHLDHGVTSRRRLPRAEIASLRGIRQALEQTFPHLRPELEEIISAVAAGLEGGPLRPAHCDLGLEHILLDGDRLALIDLDDFAEADPMLDVARVLSQLTVMSVRSRLPRGRARRAARAFTEEYFARVPDAWRARLPLYYANAVLRGAVGLTRRPESVQEEVEALVKEAKDPTIGGIW